MRFVIDYDLGDKGKGRAVVGVQAQVGWELRTKRKIGSIADGYSVSDMVGLLLEQLRIEGKLPDGVVKEADLSRHLIDLNPVDPDEDKEGGSPLEEEGSETAASSES